MPWKIHITSLVSRQILAWHLGDKIFDEVDHHLRVRLAEHGPSLLWRETHPIDGMVYRFSLDDPDVVGREHIFLFHVRYGVDEQSLWVERGAYGPF